MIDKLDFVEGTGNDLIQRYAPPSPEREGKLTHPKSLPLQGKVAFAKQMTDEVVPPAP